MTRDEMFKYLNNVQEESTETKILNAIAACFDEVKYVEDKVNELERKFKTVMGDGSAAALNPEMPVDTNQMDIIE